jgi:NADH-quinone oxidoreductase subunit M
MGDSFPILTAVTFFPLVGIILILLLDRDQHHLIRVVALLTSLVTFLLSLVLYFRFHPGTGEMQFVESYSWIPSLGMGYRLGIDGISLFLVLLTTFLTPIAIWSTWSAITERVKGFMVSTLALETGMLGVFVSLDLFLFYVFWEAMLIPMYFIIGVWGGPRRIYAAVKFILFTMTGSLLMLVAILALYFVNQCYTGVATFNLLDYQGIQLPYNYQIWMFLAFALAFAIKVPMFPLHTWLPDAHVEAPTAGSVLLAAVLLKMGTYGFLRFCFPLFPEATVHFIPLFSVLAIIGIIYGAFVALVQKDVKSLVAYSSVSHLGFVMLGLFALNMQSLQGSILQMLNHGVSTGALFLLVGMIYERRHTRLISDFGGISRVMPVFAAFFMIVALSSIGLPGTNGFVGEFLILLGTFRENWLYAAFGATGIILAAVYMLWMYQRVMFGSVDKPENEKLNDLSWREKLILVPIVVMIFWIGIYPSAFTSRMEASVAKLMETVNEKYRVEEVVPGNDLGRDLRLKESDLQVSARCFEKGAIY